MREVHAIIDILQSNPFNIPRLFPEPIKVYFASADSQYTLMSVRGINNSGSALALGLVDMRDCIVVDIGGLAIRDHPKLLLYSFLLIVLK
jgi:hypothetical protein